MDSKLNKLNNLLCDSVQKKTELMIYYQMLLKTYPDVNIKKEMCKLYKLTECQFNKIFNDSLSISYINDECYTYINDKGVLTVGFIT
jgi:hypothetical protein